MKLYDLLIKMSEHMFVKISKNEDGISFLTRPISAESLINNVKVIHLLNMEVKSMWLEIIDDIPILVIRI